MTRYSRTLVYAPEVQVYIATKNGVLDISSDIVNGQVRRVMNGVSQFSCVLNNRNNKYIGAMRRMDRIVVFMKRVSAPMQVFAGYLDVVPALSLYATTVTIRASCTLKRLMYTFWDPGLPASVDLMNLRLYQGQASKANPLSDSGMGAMMGNLLFKVGGWNRDQIHIGNIPSGFFNLVTLSDQYSNDSVLYDLFLQSLGIQSAESGTAPSTAPPSELGLHILPPANRRTYTPQDLVSICRVAGFTGEGLAIAAAVAYAASGGAYQLETYVGGVYKLGLWQADKYDIPGLTKAVSRNVLRYAQLYYKATKQGTDFKISVAYVTGAYRSFLPQFKSIVAKGQDSPVVAKYSSMPGGILDTVTGKSPSAAALFPPSTASQNDQYLANSVGTVPSYGSNPSTDLMKSIYGSTQAEVEANLVTINFQGHSVKVHKKAAAAFQAVDQQITNLNTGYKVRMVGTYAWRPKNNGSGTSELSLHSFGIAMDINWDTNGFGNAGVGPSGQHDIPDSWVQAFKSQGFGWGGDWSGSPASKDFMHFQYQGGGTYNTTGVTDASITGNAFVNGVFQFLFDGQQISTMASNSLIGAKAPINDQQLLTTVQAVASASMRSFMSGPDGSFLAFFPDYFGVFGTSPKLVLEDIELLDFRIDANDDNLTTDVFVAGHTSSSTDSPSIELADWFETQGIVNIRDKNKMKFLLGVDIQHDPEFNPLDIYERFGMRPLKAEYPQVGAHIMERGQALLLFMQKWAQQYSTQVQFTFMPELYPGMRVLIKSHQITVFVEEVTHTFGYDTGFSTIATVSSPATVGAKLRDASMTLPIGRV